MVPEPEWLTVPEVALRLRVSRMTVYRLIERGELPAHRIGAQLRVRPSDLNAYLAAARIEVTSLTNLMTRQ